jgi:hypothetical protein
MSFNFSRLFVKIALITLILASLAVTPAIAAKNEKPIVGSMSYVYDYTQGCTRYTGGGTYNWRNIYSKKVGIYDVSEVGSYINYDVCFGNIIVDQGSYGSKWHQVMKDGATFLYTGKAHGQYGLTSYKYKMAAKNGSLIMEHYWFNGVKVY